MTHAATTHKTDAEPDFTVPELAVRAVTVRFAGLVALDAVSFSVAPGSIHAVIGPNGAGKSTCFNVLSGVYRAERGTVHLGDRELTGLPPHRIAALGVARTFQNIVLTQGTVADNLMLGRHALTRAGFTATALHLPSAVREQHRHRERAREIAEFLDLGAVFDQPVTLLPYGVRKRVEMARALCMEPKVLLLDEPVAGMNADERLRTAEAITAVRDGLGISIVLVEHDMGLIMRLADEVTVLDFGRRIAGGTPDEVRQDPAVVRAYLGAGDDGDNSGNGRNGDNGDARENEERQ
ncbi:ABC transporter ATP-binding protein [Yinghuangia seranimata]|uniref:ABC transporter ATP-binding protein n=1 Tax=Yinghuangia seranimata TaxID=408067 RepID=UPI00248BB802|nr:ABC transporter ATP-binding protein [Yinghuangia seranimata]MDI2128105.1 ABC transporter ATP-binding protein [Yinghuangia seranimata]